MKTRTFITTSNADGAGALLTIAAPLAASARPEVKIAAAIPLARVSYRAEPGWDGESVTEAIPNPATVDKTTLTKAVTTAIRAETGMGAKHHTPVLYSSDTPARRLGIGRLGIGAIDVALSVMTLRRSITAGR